MPRPARVPFLFLVALSLPATSPAQTAPTPLPSPLAGPAANANPAPEPVRPKRERRMSSNLASSLSATLPKYNPPPKPNPEDEDVDLRDVDKPKNGIIRLPKYTVQEKKPPVFRERDIFNRAGFADLAKRRYLTNTYRALNSFYIPLFTASPEEHALAMYAEDERLQNMSDLKETARDVSRSSQRDAAAIRRATKDTYMRTEEFGFQPKDLRRE